MMWTSVKHARRRGFNVRKTELGWHWARITSDGWDWRPWFYPTKARALKGAYFAWEDAR